MKPFVQPLAFSLALAGLLSAWSGCSMHKADARAESHEAEPDPQADAPKTGERSREKDSRATYTAPEAQSRGQEQAASRATQPGDGVDPYAGPGDAAAPEKQAKPASRKVEPLSESDDEAGYAGPDPYAAPAPASAPKASSQAPAPEREERLSGRRFHCQSLECMPVPPPYSPPAPPRYDSEEYSPIHENAFLDARSNPLSTFSIDVDGASYANVRRFLQDNRLPPPDAVRIEELINNFSFDYPSPRGSVPFTITTETAATPWNPDTRLVLIGLQGRRIEERKLPPSNLVFLIDVSGSMASPDKLPLLKDAFELLTDRLRREDRISIVVYAGAAGIVLPPTRGDDKEAIREALSRLEAGGSTAGGAGLMLAYQAAREGFIAGGNNRVILATDGDFNVGLSSEEELVRFIGQKRKSGVFLSVLGFGTGNIKDSRMEQLANQGNGNYFYIDGIHEARKVLVERMSGTLHAIAKDVKLQVEFNPAAVRSYRLIGYENRVLAAEDFNDDAKDAGELGAGHAVTALYEVVPAAPARPRVDPLKYGGRHPEDRPRRSWFGGDGREDADELLTVKFRYKHPGSSTSRLLSRVLKNRHRALRDASENLRFAAAVAGFGLLLRESRYRGELGYGQVLALARGARGRDANGDRAEFVHLVGMAQLLGETGAYAR